MRPVSVYNPRLRSVRSILTAAVERIEQGWTRNTMRREILGQPHFCSIGAIRSVARDSDAEFRARNALEHALGVPSLMDWNDQPHMRKRDVVRAIKSVIPRI